MALNGREADIEEQARFLTTCSVCMDEFSSPKVLPCQHTFCLVCLQSFYNSVNSTRIVVTSNFPCPTCRKTCYVPLGGLPKLPDDFRIAQVLDLLTAIQSSHQKTKTKSLTFGNCSICRFQKRQNPAGSFCLQCEKAFCDECLSHHAKANIFSEHVIIKSESDNKNEKDEKIDKNLEVCNEHKGELKYVCEDCSLWLCTVCLVEEHSSHYVIEKSQFFENLNSKIQLLRNQFKTRLDKNVTMLETINSLRQQQLKSCFNCETEIKNASKTAIEEIEKLQKKLLSNIETNREVFKIETDAASKSFEKDSSHMETNIEHLDSLKHETSSNTILKEFSTFCEEIKSHSYPSIKPFVQESFKFKPSIEIKLGDLEKTKKKIDLLKLNKKIDMERMSQNDPSSSKIPSTSSLRTSSLLLNPSTPSIKSLFSNKENISKNNLFSLPSLSSKIPLYTNNSQSNLNSQGNTLFGKKKSDEPADKLIQGLGRRLSCKLTSRNSLSTARKLNWTATGFQQCRDCCFLQQNGNWLVAVCDLRAFSVLDRIKLFDLKGVQQQKLNARQIMKPWGMVFDKERNSFIITSPVNQSIKMLHIENTGNSSRVVLLQSVNDKPTGIAINSAGDYVVSDTGSRINRLAVYQRLTIQLEKKIEFGTRGRGNDEISICNYLAVDHNDRIIVSDADSKEIKILSPSGVQLLAFSCSCSFDGSKEMQPQGVAVDASGNIFVVDQAINGVGMFNPEGVLIGHVATTKGVPWGVDYLDAKKMLAVATSEGLEVFELGGVVGVEVVV